MGSCFSRRRRTRRTRSSPHNTISNYSAAASVEFPVESCLKKTQSTRLVSTCPYKLEEFAESARKALDLQKDSIKFPPENDSLTLSRRLSNVVEDVSDDTMDRPKYVSFNARKFKRKRHAFNEDLSSSSEEES